MREAGRAGPSRRFNRLREELAAWAQATHFFTFTGRHAGYPGIRKILRKTLWFLLACFGLLNRMKAGGVSGAGGIEPRLLLRYETCFAC
jgi:hypothetical protein